MAQRLAFANNYSATAASGVGGFDDTIAVDVTPNQTDDSFNPAVTRGFINVPITISWEESGQAMTEETICTGWESYPSPLLYINPMYTAGTNGQPAVITCAPNRQVMACLQSAQSCQATVAASETYEADHGVTHWLNITGACTISVEEALNNDYPSVNAEVYNGGHVTRFILTDADADQPAITWSTYDPIVWESGSPQFVLGKTRIVAEICGAGSILLGSFKLFD